MRTKNILILFGVVVLIGITIYQNLDISKQEAMLPTEVGPWKGALAPSFMLPNMDGNEDYAVGGTRAKPLFVNFWASWCGPCELEAPDLVRLYDKYHEDMDLYAVNATALDSVRDAEQFVQKHGFTFPVLMDASAEVVKKYNVMGYPTSILIDENGVVQDVILGVLPYDQLEKKVKQLIK